MDPITHAFVGMVLASRSVGELSLANGVMMAATLGAVAPDLDIVARFWGDYSYLKQHRGFSHSLPGLGIIALLTGGILSAFYPETGFRHFALWALVGGLSHTVLDLLNSYGVEILWPLSRKKVTANLIAIFDPLLYLVLALSLPILRRGGPVYPAIALFLLYLFVRVLMRAYARCLVRKKFERRFPRVKVVVMPSACRFFKWDFIAAIPGKNIVGTVNLLGGKLFIARKLLCLQKEMAEVLAATALGRVFGEFTPHFHIECEKVGDKLVGHFMDLRYRFGGRFLHNGTLVMDREMKVEKAIFQPFSTTRCVYIQK